ncbi:MAG: YigZ family protein [Clostridia bacterium]|nr:YigZ family protein [Clostridia bacterium]MBQ7289175.1 YigZ family protein [Clostridia bacterium]
MSYKTILEPSVGELTEQRSRFLSFLYPVANEEAALQQIQSHRQKYWDARHNVFAYRLFDESISRFSDDGEPHSTAGKPILDTLNGAELNNCLLIVTRYFGGVLLGTGGLVRAYSGAARLAIAAANIVEIRSAVRYRLVTPYPMFDKLSAFLSAQPAKILSTQFNETVLVELVVPSEESERFCSALRDAFFNTILPQFVSEEAFAF